MLLQVQYSQVCVSHFSGTRVGWGRQDHHEHNVEVRMATQIIYNERIGETVEALELKWNTSGVKKM